MNAHEQILNTASTYENNGFSEHAAALRELDQLLASFVSIEREQHHGREDKFSTHGPCDICDLVIRAAQAGYGDK